VPPPVWKGSAGSAQSTAEALAAAPPDLPRGEPVSDHVYRVTEVVGTSPDSVQQAIRNGIARVSRTVRNVEWFEATEIRGQVVDGEIAHFQVALKVGFRLE
jgi:flavin-binding protein dodecin